MRLAAFTLLVGLGCCGLGFSLGRGSRAELRAEREAAMAAQADRPGGPRVPGVCVASLDADVLRSELARALGGGAVGPSGAPQPTAAPTPAKAPGSPPSPEQLAALDNASNGVDRAIAAGSLTATQARDLRGLMETVDADSRYELTSRLMVAMNQDKLHVEDHRLPF